MGYVEANAKVNDENASGIGYAFFKNGIQLNNWNPSVVNASIEAENQLNLFLYGVESDLLEVHTKSRT